MAKPDPEALAKALRDNLKRRKEQARDLDGSARGAPNDDGDGDADREADD